MVEEWFVMGRLKTCEGSEKTSASQVWNYSNKLPKAEKGLNCIVLWDAQLAAAEVAVALHIPPYFLLHLFLQLCEGTSLNPEDKVHEMLCTWSCGVRSVWQNVPKEKSVTSEWRRDESTREWAGSGANLVPGTKVCNLLAQECLERSLPTNQVTQQG